MNSRIVPSLVVAVAILLASVALGAPLAGADDRGNSLLADRGEQVRGVADRPSPPSRAAADANATDSTRDRPVAPDAVILDVQVYENGTAEWTVVYRTRLDDAETTAAFRDYAADVGNDSRRYGRQFAERMNRTLRTAERATGREMQAADYSVRAETHNFPKRYGVVAYSFEWHGFANVSDDRVRVGDALAGLALDAKTQLCVEWPAGYEATTIRSRPETGFEERERAVVWDGPVEFASDEPRIVLAASDTDGTGERGRWSFDGEGTGPRLPVSPEVYLR